MRLLRLLARAIQLVGACLLFGGLLWVKGPAITLIEYLWGFGSALVGFGILLLGSLWQHPKAPTQPNEQLAASQFAFLA